MDTSTAKIRLHRYYQSTVTETRREPRILIDQVDFTSRSGGWDSQSILLAYLPRPPYCISTSASCILKMAYATAHIAPRLMYGAHSVTCTYTCVPVYIFSRNMNLQHERILRTAANRSLRLVAQPMKGLEQHFTSTELGLFARLALHLAFPCASSTASHPPVGTRAIPNDPLSVYILNLIKTGMFNNVKG